MCLPVFLASCNELVILAGETYLLRLWCVVEVFCFLEMGGQADMVQLVPVGLKRISTDSFQKEEEVRFFMFFMFLYVLFCSVLFCSVFFFTACRLLLYRHRPDDTDHAVHWLTIRRCPCSM